MVWGATDTAATAAPAAVAATPAAVAGAPTAAAAAPSLVATADAVVCDDDGGSIRDAHGGGIDGGLGVRVGRSLQDPSFLGDGRRPGVALEQADCTRPAAGVEDPVGAVHGFDNRGRLGAGVGGKVG